MSERDRSPRENRGDVPGGHFDPGRTAGEVTARTGDHYEQTDVRSRPMIIFMIGVLAALAIINIAIGGFGLLLYVRHRAAVRPRSELTTRPQPFPEPRLQSNPKADMARMLAEEEQMQTSYGWVDRKAGVARIPIGQAMELIAQRGLPPKRSDIPTTAGAYAAAQARAAQTSATQANIRAAQTTPPTGAAPAPTPSTPKPTAPTNQTTTTTRKAGP